MDITSVNYLIFVGVSLFIYWYSPHKYQWIILLIDSVIFYILNAEIFTLVYVLVSAISAYFAGLLFEAEKNVKKKRAFLWILIIVNAGILIVLKYSNMVIVSINYVFRTNVGLLHITSSLAVSYYTFQIIAYVVDCYYGRIEPERNYFKLLLYTMYFPQMVSGPISRWSDLGHQLFEEHRFEYDRVTTGMRRVLWGIGKKVVVADRLAILVNYMFDNIDVYSGLWIVIAALSFVTELYFDFSGCMDIIIGVSECFGIRLSENFQSPFMSKSVQEFWQRWHITLGGWLRDYIMYPISRTKAFKEWGRICKKRYGKRGIQIPYYVAMFVVWTAMGIWHGNSWKYVIGEGWFFWILIVLSQIFAPAFKKAKSVCGIKDDNMGWKIFQVVRTAVLFALGNIAFRAASLSQTFNMFRKMFVFSDIVIPFQKLPWDDFGGNIAFIGVGIIVSLQLFSDICNYRGKNVQELLKKQVLPGRWVLYFGLTMIILLAGAFGKSQFIYFGF